MKNPGLDKTHSDLIETFGFVGKQSLPTQGEAGLERDSRFSHLIRELLGLTSATLLFIPEIWRLGGNAYDVYRSRRDGQVGPGCRHRVPGHLPGTTIVVERPKSNERTGCAELLTKD